MCTIQDISYFEYMVNSPSYIWDSTLYIDLHMETCKANGIWIMQEDNINYSVYIIVVQQGY